jgi:hypothetical protein
MYYTSTSLFARRLSHNKHEVSINAMTIGFYKSTVIVPYTLNFSIPCASMKHLDDVSDLMERGQFQRPEGEQSTALDGVESCRTEARAGPTWENTDSGLRE